MGICLYFSNPCLSLVSVYVMCSEYWPEWKDNRKWQNLSVTALADRPEFVFP